MSILWIYFYPEATSELCEFNYSCNHFGGALDFCCTVALVWLQHTLMV